MKARELKAGDLFKVNPPDPESPIRICISNSSDYGIRFGWPNNPAYWCYMGEEVEVELVNSVAYGEGIDW